MGVCGKYKPAFTGASHVVFEGCLDNPAFREVAIQRLKAGSGGTIEVERSGVLPVERDKYGEYVTITYTDWAFQFTTRTKGRPFKDEHTDAVGEAKTC